MPRPRPQSSALRAPLDFILGTHGAVRALRVLCATEVPLSQSELARRAALSPSGVPAMLATLESAGIIDYAGRGRTRQVQLRRSHPLMASLQQLFRDETERWRRIQQLLREIVGTVADSIISAWIEGPVTTERDRFGDSLVVGILSEKPLPIAAQEALRKRVNQVQSSQHVVISLRFHQRADLLRFTTARRAMLSRAAVLFGPAPIDLVNSAPQRGGSRGDGKRTATARGRPSIKAIAERIAERIIQEPEVVARARTHIERRLPLAGEVERLALLEWQGLLDSLTAGQIAAILREDSERADVLRQNLPFAGTLSDDERRKLFPSARAVAKRRT